MLPLWGLQHQAAGEVGRGEVPAIDLRCQGAEESVGRGPPFQPSPVAAFTGRARVRAACSGPGSGPPSAVPDEDDTDGIFIVIVLRLMLEAVFGFRVLVPFRVVKALVWGKIPI